MIDWREIPIGELCSGIFDGPHATPKKTSEGPIFLGISSLDRGRLEFNQIEHLSEEDFVTWMRRVTPQPGDVVFSYETRLGEAAIIPDGLRCCLGRRMALMRPNLDRVAPCFLLYAYLGPQFQEIIRSRTIHGSTVDRIPLVDFPEFPIRVPPLPEQRAIAHILGTLDDKIELNRRMNQTLEEIARTLFKSWFVDFDPVRAKAEGREPDLPPGVAVLFPDSLEESSIGLVPSGWETLTWGDLVTLEYGKALKGYDREDGRVPVYGTNGRIGTTDQALCDQPGIIVGRKGAYRGIHYSNTSFYVIDTAFYVAPKVPLDLRWAYYELVRRDINSLDSGSAIPSTSREDFYSIPVLVPPFELQTAYSEVLKPMWTQQRLNEAQAQTLSVARDTLLPRLLSGELRIDGAESVSPVSALEDRSLEPVIGR